MPTGRWCCDRPQRGHPKRSEISAEEIKIELNSNQNEGFSRWLYLGGRLFKLFFDKEEYVALANALIVKTESAVNKSLRSLGLQFTDIHKIVLIGGASSSHLVYDFWKQKIDESRQKIIYHQPLTSVAKGAALYANSISKNASGFQSSFDLKNVSTYNIAIQDANTGNVEIIVNKNLPLPVTGTKILRVMPNRHIDQLQFALVQFFDQSEDTQELGMITVKELPVKSTEYQLEISVENKANGTIGLKVRELQTMQNVKFTFSKKAQQFQYNFEEQYRLINSYYINSIS